MIKSLEKVNIDNYYSLLPDYLEYIISNYTISKSGLLDICFAICNADSLVGTNKQQLSIEKFTSSSTDEWLRILSLLDCNVYGSNQLPKIQQARVICDAMLIVLKLNNIDIDCNFNAEASRFVARNVLKISIRGTNEDKLNSDIVICMNKIYDRLSDKIEEVSNTSIPTSFSDLIKYLTSVDKALHRVLSEEFINNIGDIKIIESILYRNTYGDLMFSEELLNNEVFNDDCKAFVKRNFTVVTDYVDIHDLESAFTQYLKYWKSSLVFVTSLVINFYFKISPVYTVSCLRELQSRGVFPVGIAVTNQNTNIARKIKFDSAILLSRFNDLCNNNNFTSESVIGLFTIISSISSNKLISESELKEMIIDVRI